MLHGAQDYAQIVVGRRVVGVEADGLAIGGFGRGTGVGAEVEIAEIGVVVGIGLAEGDDLFEAGKGGLVVAGPAGKARQTAVGWNVIGVEG